MLVLTLIFSWRVRSIIDFKNIFDISYLQIKKYLAVVIVINYNIEHRYIFGVYFVNF